MSRRRAGLQALSLSSRVAYGAVGNGVIGPGLGVFGCEAVTIDTLTLSTHPGIAKPVGRAMEANELAAMLDALAEADVLAGLSGVVSGYFADAGQVAVAGERIARLKDDNPGLVYLCDPVIGDGERGRYVAAQTAAAIRDRLLPLADVATPNRFELAWLSGGRVNDLGEAIAAAKALAPGQVVVTSAPDRDGAVATCMVDDESVDVVRATNVANVPHGVGDLFAGLYLGARLAGRANCLARAHQVLQRIIAASSGRRTLDMTRLFAGNDEEP